MKNHGKPVLLKDKIAVCLDRAETSLLEEKLSSLQKRQLELEEKVKQAEKIAFSYLSAVQKLTQEIVRLKRWRDHKIRR